MLDGKIHLLEICAGVLVLVVRAYAGFISKFVEITATVLVGEDVAVFVNVGALKNVERIVWIIPSSTLNVDCAVLAFVGIRERQNTSIVPSLGGSLDKIAPVYADV